MSIRTNTEVGVLKVSPEGNSEINYYFCIFDLPVPEGDDPEVYFQDGQYNSSENTLSYTFTEYTAADPQVTKSYKLPIFLEQYVDGDTNDPIVIESVTVSGTVSGNETTGTSSEIKTSTLDQEFFATQSNVSTDAAVYGINFIRTLFLISETHPDTYFLILFVRTNQSKDEGKGVDKLLKVEIDGSDSTLLIASFTNNDNVVTDSESIVAAHMLGTTRGEYTKVKIKDVDGKYSINYPVLL